MTIGIRPNTVGPVVELSAMMREIHADNVAAIQKQRAERKNKPGVPDSEIDYSKAASACDAAAAHLRGGNAASASIEVKNAVDILSVVPGDVPDFEAPESCAGVRVRIRYLSEAERVQFADAIDAARTAARGDGASISWARVAAIHSAQQAFVARAIAHVDGLSEWDGDNIKPLAWSCVGANESLPAEALAVLNSAGVLSFASDVAMHAQGLPAKKAMRFGLPPQQT